MIMVSEMPRLLGFRFFTFTLSHPEHRLLGVSRGSNDDDRPTPLTSVSASTTVLPSFNRYQSVVLVTSQSKETVFFNSFTAVKQSSG
jgi:hypothetical protein